MATNANGNVVWKEDYRAYGERRLGQPGSEGQRQWFHGKEADAGTGLQYFGARYYDPAVGRFMGVDPVTFQEDNLHSFNRYAYGNNNPVAYLDPDGNLPILLLIPLAVKAVDFALTGVELYGAYQTGGMSALALATADNAAWSVVPGAKTGKTLYKYGRSADSASAAANSVGTAAKQSDNVIHVTSKGVALPPGPKYKIPDHYVQNPNPKASGNYGEIVNGKYRERLAIHPDHGTGRGSHYHLDGTGSTHNSPRPGNPDPGFTPP